eukprot:81786-Pyramimonas_sp.AAC.1
MMFTAFVFGAGRGGLAALVLPAASANALDALFGKYLRTLARGAMPWTTEAGDTGCKSTKQVFKWWRLERSAVALRTRRLKWYQKWALYPAEHAN